MLQQKQTRLLETEALDANEAYEKAWIAHVLTQDVILRLCKLGEDAPKSSNSWSFDQVGKELCKRAATEKQVEGYEVLLKSYRSELGHLKEQHRNKYIAHLPKKPSGKDVQPKPITSAIPKGLAILDKFAGQKVAFIEPDGETDLRAEFEKLISKPL